MIRALLFAFILFASPAFAQAEGEQADEQARVLYQNGTNLFDEGRYADAIAAWEMAYVLSPRPLLLVNMASAFERLGDNVAALDKLYRYKAFAPPSERSTIERRIRSLEARMDEDRAIEEAQPVAQPVAPRASVTKPKPAPEPFRPSAEPRRVWTVGTGPVVLYSLAGAGAVAGVVFAFRADSARMEAAELCSSDDAVFCRSSASEALMVDQTSSLIADGSFGFAGLAVVTGTVWMFASNGRQTAVRVGPVGRGIGLQGVF
jgi:tetratricopeptide (TPR) repeat protein